MSLNVLVIPEDFRKDQHILKPLIERMVSSLGRKPKVVVCKDPLLAGIGEALKWRRIEQILDRYRGMTDVFLLIVDRDGNERRQQKLEGLEKKAANHLSSSNSIFFSEHAWQELEVWLLAGMKDLPESWSWAEIRAEIDPKERFFSPYVRQRGMENAPYEGRELLGKEAARNYSRIRKLCPEDVLRLERRLVKRNTSDG